MLPSGRMRARFFNRNSKIDYIHWLSSKTGVEYRPELAQMSSRLEIDAFFEERVKSEEEENPSWVQAAIEVEGIHWTGSTDNDEGLILTEHLEEVIEDGIEPLQEDEGDVEEEREPEAQEEALEDEDDETEEVDSPIESSPFIINDYNSYTIRELQDLCRVRGLTIRGTKAEVVLRLRRDDEGIAEPQPTENDTEAPSEEAAEESLAAPVENTAATEEVINNDSSGQEPDINEEE